jgi:hypothetical protein
MSLDITHSEASTCCRLCRSCVINVLKKIPLLYFLSFYFQRVYYSSLNFTCITNLYVYKWSYILFATSSLLWETQHQKSISVSAYIKDSDNGQ